MSLKHLSEKEIYNYIDESYHINKNEDIREHLISCEKCRQKLNDYQLMISEIKRIKVYEPDNKFYNIVTANFPDKYPKKEKPLLEIFSLIMIFIPFGIVAGFLFHSTKFNFSSLEKMFNIISSLIYSIYDSLNSIRFIHDNIDVFGLFIFYMLVFSILNWFFIYGKPKKKNLQVMY